MFEADKIQEADFFFSLMVKEKENHEHFKFYLSAFLSSARSVLQYALKEAESKSGGSAWYGSQVNSAKTVKYFQDKRDINIHAQPVSPKKNVLIKVSETIHISDSISVEIRDSEGNVKGRYDSPPAPPNTPVEDMSTIETEYKFDDWGGNEDVITLCRIYLTELKGIVAYGKGKGFLT